MHLHRSPSATLIFVPSKGYLNAEGVMRISMSLKFLVCLVLTLYRRRGKLEKKMSLLQHATSSEALALFPDFQQRLGVLRR